MLLMLMLQMLMVMLLPPITYPTFGEQYGHSRSNRLIPQAIDAFDYGVL